MKNWHLGLLAASALASIAGVACYAYNKRKKKQSPKTPKRSEEHKADVIEVIQQCVIENMNTYLRIYQLGLQIKNSQEWEKAKLKEELKKKSRIEI